jgi:hypothetical protein
LKYIPIGVPGGIWILITVPSPAITTLFGPLILVRYLPDIKWRKRFFKNN